VLPSQTRPLRRRRRAVLLTAALVATCATLSSAPPAAAQPPGGYAAFPGGTPPGYLEVPHDPALDVAGAWTVEMWVWPAAGTAGVRWLLVKDVNDGYRVNLSGRRLQSGINAIDGGKVFTSEDLLPLETWSHVAVTSDGVTRRHLVDGEVVDEFAETPGVVAESGTEARPLYLGFAENIQESPGVRMDEVRLWNVARTPQQIRDSMNMALATPRSGLVAVWPLDGDGHDAVGGHDGVAKGGISFAAEAGPCVPSDTVLCLRDGRFRVEVDWETASGGQGQGMVVPGVTSDSSGILWFFNPNNWEMLVKVLNGCPVTQHWWVFFAATTNVEFDLRVTDTEKGTTRTFHNDQGHSADAVTETAALPCS
jgi:hypothetical protein